jgi:hypothetical protein
LTEHATCSTVYRRDTPTPIPFQGEKRGPKC